MLRRRLAALLVLHALWLAPQAYAVDIHGDDAGDTFTGVGGLVLPSTVDAQTRHEAAGCEDCAWQVGDPCDTPYGNAFLRCHSHALSCPPGSQERRAWMRHGDGQWYDQGLLCVTAGGPPTVGTVGVKARGAFVEHLPGLAPSVQPSQGVVTQLPVLFDTGQASGTVSIDVVLAGTPVHLEARPRWTWTYGDGSTSETVFAGSHWPLTSVSHVYRHSGQQQVRVVTTWSATYWVDGLGPFPVAEDVHQDALMTVPVGEGRAALTRYR